MEDLSKIKKLIEDQKALQNKNLKLVEVLDSKLSVIRDLKESEISLQSRIRDVLVQTVNSENLCNKYFDLKEQYDKLIQEKKRIQSDFQKREIELTEQHDKQLKLYREMLAKEQEKFKLKEMQYNNKLKATPNILTEKLNEVQSKWKILLDDANRKLNESNLSSTTLRSQLMQANQKNKNFDYLEKRVRELEAKLEAKESELVLTRQALYVKENFRQPNGSPHSGDLCKTNKKVGYKLAIKTSTPKAEPRELTVQNLVSQSVLPQGTPGTSTLERHNLTNSSSANAEVPVRDRPKKRRLYNGSM